VISKIKKIYFVTFPIGLALFSV